MYENENDISLFNTSHAVDRMKEMNVNCDKYSIWIELAIYTILFIGSTYVFMVVVCFRQSKNRPLVCLLVSLFFANLLIFPYGIITITDFYRHEKILHGKYHTWVHFLGSAGIFFAGLSYWIFSAAYLKTSLILKKLLRKMKLEIYSPR